MTSVEITWTGIGGIVSQSNPISGQVDNQTIKARDVQSSEMTSR